MLITPWPAVVACMAIISGLLSDRFSPDVLCTTGLLILSLGMFALSVLPDHVAFIDVGWRMVVCGVGFGLYQAPNLKMMMFSAPLQRGVARAQSSLSQDFWVSALAQSWCRWLSTYYLSVGLSLRWGLGRHSRCGAEASR